MITCGNENDKNNMLDNSGNHDNPGNIIKSVLIDNNRKDKKATFRPKIIGFRTFLNPKNKKNSRKSLEIEQEQILLKEEARLQEEQFSNSFDQKDLADLERNTNELINMNESDEETSILDQENILQFKEFLPNETFKKESYSEEKKNAKKSSDLFGKTVSDNKNNSKEKSLNSDETVQEQIKSQFKESKETMKGN